MGLQVASLHHFRPGCVDRTRRHYSAKYWRSLYIHCMYIYIQLKHTIAWLSVNVGGRLAKTALLCHFLSRQHTECEIQRWYSCASTLHVWHRASQLQVALSSSTSWKSWFTFMKHCLIFFFNKHTHKVTQVSSGFHWNSGKRPYLNQFLIFSSFLAHFVQEKNHHSSPIAK